ncbi:hypothetical protein [Streptomyces sp. NRRL B-1347]|uniref:hypothetical protein n=1 Tax=Streptomyces sp. NRRL B-1347 TaxID=1476877 RepID=UPI0004CB89CC|nr:hypothetical protein [Streptomyces sp. NRRL B-1347]
MGASEVSEVSEVSGLSEVSGWSGAFDVTVRKGSGRGPAASEEARVGVRADIGVFADAEI